jgi:large subunit ribosomal protein L35
MPKGKAHKATAKRFKVTGRRKLRRLRQRRSHRRRAKSKRVRRSFDKDHPVTKADRRRLQRLLVLRQKE